MGAQVVPSNLPPSPPTQQTLITYVQQSVAGHTDEDPAGCSLRRILFAEDRRIQDVSILQQSETVRVLRKKAARTVRAG